MPGRPARAGVARAGDPLPSWSVRRRWSLRTALGAARRVPAAISVNASATLVDVGGTVLLTGVVTADDGKVLKNRQVRLVSRHPGQSGWTQVAAAATGRDGSVSLGTAPLDRNVVLKLRTGNKVQSDPVRVVVVPTISATAGVGSIQVATAGGLPGDVVVLLRWKLGQLVQVGRAQLDGSGATQFSIEPPKNRPARYVVRLKATNQHAGAKTNLRIEPTG
jgi:hypothetical protein